MCASTSGSEAAPQTPYLDRGLLRVKGLGASSQVTIPLE
jgi:hypothetical protein